MTTTPVEAVAAAPVLARDVDTSVARAELEAPQVELVDRGAVQVLVTASAASRLAVGASRALRMSGSVSERVARKALSSLPVVRSRAMGR